MGLVGALYVYIDDGGHSERQALSLLAGTSRKQLLSGGGSGKGSAEVCDVHFCTDSTY